MTWVIIRTDHAKEAFVARQIALMGYQAWVPAQIIVCRPTVARRLTAKAQLAKLKELPILPRRLFVELDGPVGSDITSIRHYDGVERDAEQRFIRIPDAEIRRFRAAIDAENTAALALSQRASRKQRAKWRDLKEALLELIDGAKQQMEQAA